MRALELTGCSIALVAALLIASNTYNEHMGFALFLCSNALIIPFAYVNKLWGIMMLNVAFAAINVWGLWNWWV